MRHPDAAVVKSGNAVFQLIHVFRSCDGCAADRSLAALVSGYRCGVFYFFATITARIGAGRPSMVLLWSFGSR